jgi:hypothetical protein
LERSCTWQDHTKILGMDTQPTTSPKDDYVRLDHLVSGGDISKASKRELERFAVMLSRPNAHSHFSAPSFPQICETVRTLLIVRMSEEANKEATRISKIALRIAWAALVVALVQAALTVWALLFKA